MESQQAQLDQADSETTTADEDSPGSLRLSHQNENGNAIVVRTYENHTEFVRGTDEEWMYNYQTEKWECVSRFVHDYELCDDGQTLAGDGSNWRGTSQNWREWFTQRHYERIAIRFPMDDPPEQSRENHDAAPSPRTDATCPAH